MRDPLAYYATTHDDAQPVERRVSAASAASSIIGRGGYGNPDQLPSRTCADPAAVALRLIETD